MKLLVITWVPDPDGPGLEAQGNMAAPLAELFVKPSQDAQPVRLETFGGLPRGLSLVLLRQVFAKGELLLVDDDGRELGGRMRKPSKWHVKTQSFELSELESAIELVQALAADPVTP